MQRPKNKLLIVGNVGAGKKSIESYFKKTLGDDSAITLAVVDNPGYQKIGVNINYRSFDGFLVVCDLSDPLSIKDVKSWLMEIERYAGFNKPIILIGNKCDLKNIHEDIFSEACDVYHLRYAYVSANKGTGLAELFKNAEKIFNEEQSVNRCLADARPTAIKRSILIEAEIEVSKSRWDKLEKSFFWKKTAAPIKALRNLLKADIETLSNDKIDALFDKYSIALKEARNQTKNEDKNLIPLYDKLDAAICKFIISNSSPEKRLHHAAGVLFQQQILPSELNEHILHFVAQNMNVPLQVASEIVGTESVREHALQNLYYVCVVLKYIYKTVIDKDNDTLINELREIETCLNNEMNKQGSEHRNVGQLNEQKASLLKKYGRAILLHSPPDSTVKDNLDQLIKDNLADGNFANKLDAFKEACLNNEPSHGINRNTRY